MIEAAHTGSGDHSRLAHHLHDALFQQSRRFAVKVIADVLRVVGDALQFQVEDDAAGALTLLLCLPALGAGLAGV